jgi:hypothetical protein
MQHKKTQKNRSFVSLSFKYGVIFLLFTLSIILVACGANSEGNTATSAGATATPKATSTMINFNKINQVSPTPALPAQWCGVWVTNESPAYSGGSIPIYAKFVKQQDGNPVGIGGASVSITIQWGDYSTPPPLSTTTTADGLGIVYASMAGHAGAINKLSLITATFNSGSVTCSVGTDRPASFALTAGVATTKTPTPTGGRRNP